MVTRSSVGRLEAILILTCLVSQQPVEEDIRHAILSFVLKLKFVAGLHIYLLFDYNFPSGKELVLTRI